MNAWLSGVNAALSDRSMTLRRPRLLVLDEATSALSDTERRLTSNLMRA